MTDVPVYLRNSERKAFLTCQQMWKWSYQDLLQTRGVRPALDFGGLVHEALAAYYVPGRKRGPKPWVTFEALLNTFEEEHGIFQMSADDEKVTARELGDHMLRRYVENYGPDSHIKVIAPEMDFKVEAYWPDGRRVMVRDESDVLRPLVHVGTGDLVYYDMERRQLGVMETKTAAKIEVDHLGKDDQASSYWTLVPIYLRQIGLLEPGQDIAFIEYNFLRKALNDERPQNADGLRLNKNGSVSERQPAPYFRRHRVWRGESDRLRYLLRINNLGGVISLARRGKLPIIKNPSSAYPDQHCRGCEFRDMCDIHEMGGDWQGYAENVMGRWAPYEAHEMKEET